MEGGIRPDGRTGGMGRKTYICSSQKGKAEVEVKGMSRQTGQYMMLADSRFDGETRWSEGQTRLGRRKRRKQAIETSFGLTTTGSKVDTNMWEESRFEDDMGKGGIRSHQGTQERRAIHEQPLCAQSNVVAGYGDTRTTEKEMAGETCTHLRALADIRHLARKLAFLWWCCLLLLLWRVVRIIVIRLWAQLTAQGSRVVSTSQADGPKTTNIRIQLGIVDDLATRPARGCGQNIRLVEGAQFVVADTSHIRVRPVLGSALPETRFSGQFE